MQKSWTAQRPHLEYPFEIFGISPRNTKGARCSSKYFLSISNLEKRWNPFLYAKRCCSLEYFCINLDFGWILLMQRHIAVHEADEAEWKFIVIFLKKQRQSKSLGAHSSNQEPPIFIFGEVQERGKRNKNHLIVLWKQSFKSIVNKNDRELLASASFLFCRRNGGHSLHLCKSN